MAEGSSKSDSETVDIHSRSFIDEDFKGEFTNALSYANSIYESHGLLTKNPPAKITSVSMAMADTISSAVIDILNDNYVMTEEDLILYDDSDTEGLYEEVCCSFFLLTIELYNYKLYFK